MRRGNAGALPGADQACVAAWLALVAGGRPALAQDTSHTALLVDNVRTAHAREPFEGPREVVVAMADGVRVTDL